MSDSFGVHHGNLADSAQTLTGLPGQAGTLGRRVQQALTGLAQAAGHEGLATALMETNLLNARRLTELCALYDHIQQSVTLTAKDYAGSDTNAASRVLTSENGAS
jgi:uncharacterized protein YukE